MKSRLRISEFSRNLKPDRDWRRDWELNFRDLHLESVSSRLRIEFLGPVLGVALAEIENWIFQFTNWCHWYSLLATQNWIEFSHLFMSGFGFFHCTYVFFRIRTTSGDPFSTPNTMLKDIGYGQNVRAFLGIPRSPEHNVWAAFLPCEWTKCSSIFGGLKKSTWRDPPS